MQCSNAQLAVDCTGRELCGVALAEYHSTLLQKSCSTGYNGEYTPRPTHSFPLPLVIS